MDTQVIQVPYDSGHKGFGMGNGPAHLVKNGLAELPEVYVEAVEVEELSFELGTTFRVLRSLSEKVAAAIESDRLPLVLAGNCICSVGTLAGLGESSAIVWLDAHGDLNTPETTASGFLDGMALAAATGRCWQNLTSSVSGFQPVFDRNVILIGARDLDPKERTLLEASGIAWIDTATLRQCGVKNALGGALERLEPEQVYLHVDLDVLDVDEAHVNRFSSAGGLTVAESLETVRVVADARSIAAAAITAYDPAYDSDGKALHAAAAVVKELIAHNPAAMREVRQELKSR